MADDRAPIPHNPVQSHAIKQNGSHLYLINQYSLIIQMIDNANVNFKIINACFYILHPLIHTGLHTLYEDN